MLVDESVDVEERLKEGNREGQTRVEAVALVYEDRARQG